MRCFKICIVPVYFRTTTTTKKKTTQVVRVVWVCLWKCKNADFVKNNITILQYYITYSWVYGYDSETKCPTSPTEQKARQVRSKTKEIMLVIYECEGIVHHKYAPPGQPINKKLYVIALRRLREDVRRKRPNLMDGQWMIHHDGAPAFTLQLVQVSG